MSSEGIALIFMQGNEIFKFKIMIHTESFSSKAPKEYNQFSSYWHWVLIPAICLEMYQANSRYLNNICLITELNGFFFKNQISECITGIH